MFDAIIVGGGPGGLSAALALGRCRRKVLLCDKGEPRNAASKGMHGYLSRDGVDPMEFLRLAREDLQRYPNIEQVNCEIVEIERKEGEFTVRSDFGCLFNGRMLLLATGIVDELPGIEGLHRFYGRSIHHCPYCDGWEHQDQPLAVVGEIHDAVQLAIKMCGWSHNVTLCLADAHQLRPEERESLELSGVRLKQGEIERCEGEDVWLREIVFKDGSRLECKALFVVPLQRPRADLACSLGCELVETGQIGCGETLETNIKGVFAVGNASPGLQLVVIAVAEGTKAAFIIDEALREAELAKKRADAKRVH